MGLEEVVIHQQIRQPVVAEGTGETAAAESDDLVAEAGDAHIVAVDFLLQPEGARKLLFQPRLQRQHPAHMGVTPDHPVAGHHRAPGHAPEIVGKTGVLQVAVAFGVGPAMAQGFVERYLCLIHSQ